MDYTIYDALQASLGGVGSAFQTECKRIIEASSTDQETKILASELCNQIEKALNELAKSISETLIASSK